MTVETDVKKPSMAKSLVAQARPRVGGRFVPINETKESTSASKETDAPEETNASSKKRKAQKQKEITKEELIYDTRVIAEDDKDFIGDDSRKFFEMALRRSRTWSEAYKYAKELKPLQHPSLQATSIKAEVEVTRKVLTWEWDGGDSVGAIDVIKPLVLDVAEEGDSSNGE